MPFESKAQMRLFFAKEKHGELPKGTAKKWADHTPDIKSLPEHVKKHKKKKHEENVKAAQDERQFPDLPMNTADTSVAWTQGGQNGFSNGFAKTSAAYPYKAQSLAGSTDKALQRFNSKVMGGMKPVTSAAVSAAKPASSAFMGGVKNVLKAAVK